MKNIAYLILLLLSLLWLVGCNIDSSTDNSTKNDILENVYIKEIDRIDTEFDTVQHLFDLSEDVLKEIVPIDTNQVALDIGKKIIEEIHAEGKLFEYTLVSIAHSKEDNLWRFEYSIDQQNSNVDNLIDCGCLYVVIDGNQGALIKSWIEE